MELAFNTKPLRKLCESNEKAVSEFGPELADALKARLSDLRAAATVDSLPLGNPRIRGDNGDPQMVLDLAYDRILVFVPNHVSYPLLENGKVDWSRVRRIKIVGIEDANDQD